jgi:hypothetical protein
MFKMKISNVLRYVFIVFIICYLLYPGVGNIMLKRYGICGKGKLLKETMQLRYQKPLLLYQF